MIFDTILAVVVAASTPPNANQQQIEHRGAAVMPFDQSRTMHHFVKTASGGVQTVLSLDRDPKQIALIRGHLRLEARRFARGDFEDPAAIHGERMPGLNALRHAGSSLTTSYADVAGGGRIAYRASDPAVIAALHRWFDAQVSDHGAHAMKM